MRMRTAIVLLLAILALSVAMILLDRAIQSAPELDLPRLSTNQEQILQPGTYPLGDIFPHQNSGWIILIDTQHTGDYDAYVVQDDHLKFDYANENVRQAIVTLEGTTLQLPYP